MIVVSTNDSVIIRLGELAAPVWRLYYIISHVSSAKRRIIEISE